MQAARNGARPFAFALLLITSCPSSWAQDIYIEQSIAVPAMGAQAPQKLIIKIWSTADKLRTEQPSGGGRITTIVRTDLGKIWRLSEASKSYVELPLDALQGMTRSMAALMEGDEAQVSLKATGNTRKIGNWNCQEYLLSVTGRAPITLQVWASPDVKFDPALYRRITDVLGPTGQLGPLAEKIREIKGYPIQIVTKMVLGTRIIESTTTVEKISQEKIDPAVFDVPPDYKRLETPSPPRPSSPSQ